MGDLAAFLEAVSPVDLPIGMYGWAVADIPTNIAYAPGPGDLFANITGISPKDLSVFLKACLGIAVPYDLNLKIQSYYNMNLGAIVSTIPAVDLLATLIPRCTAVNLTGIIYPKVVYVRTLLSLSYLECLDLAASINPDCFSTSYVNLMIELYSMHSKNLPASLFGTDGSNICDLNIFINDYDYYEEDVFKLKIFKDPVYYTSLNLKSGDFKKYTECTSIPLYIKVLSYSLYSFGDNISYIGNVGSTVAQNVWDYDYIIVYHMAQDPTTGILDSTGKLNNGSAYGSMTSTDLVSGEFGNAVEFDGLNDYIACNDGLLWFSTGDAFFLSCKIKITGPLSVGGVYQNVIFSVNSTSWGNGLRIGVDGIAGGLYICTIDDSDTGSGDQVRGTGLIDGNTHYIAVFVDGLGNKLAWIDGVVPITTYTSKQVGWDTSGYMSIGQEWDGSTTPSDFFPGIIEELHISNTVRPNIHFHSMNDSLIYMCYGNNQYTINFTIDSDLIDETLYDTPIMVNLSSDSGINSFDASNVFESLGENEFKFKIETEEGVQCYTEIEFWDYTNRKAVLWVKIPLISANIDTVLSFTYAYKVAEHGSAVLGVSIIPKPIEVNLGAFVRAYTQRSYEMPSVREKFITLKLNHNNVEEWRRHVELTFNSYIRSYYYFSGNQKAYREFLDDQWIIQVKGYNLANLPTGIERSKINRKYIFDLKRYASIDAAIRDMIDRVTALKAQDLGCSVIGKPKKEANLSVLISSNERRVYKSNRMLPVSINPYIAIYTVGDERIYDNNDNLILL